MSTAPSRTRSLRKPAEIGSSRNGRPPTAEPAGNDARPGTSKVADRDGQSPSRLPVKPSTRHPSTTSTRSLSSAGGTAVNPLMRPPPSRVNIGKSTNGGLQKSSSNYVSDITKITEPVKQDRSKPGLTTSRHLRNPSASSINTSTRAPSHTSHARTKSSSTILSTSTVLRPRTREETLRQTHTESQLQRPAFSTLQQHFSPAKSLAPKPHPAAFLAPPSPSKLPSNIAISAETAKLQNELLQLHLLHKDIVQVENDWRDSAKGKLGARFQSVVDKSEALLELEVEETAKINAAALRKWQDSGAPGWGLEERIQALDEVVTGVWNLGESGGKYPKIVRKFEKWLSRCQDILETRTHEHIVNDDQDEILFLEELDPTWKDDCLVLERKLETWRARLNGLGSPESGSSLATIVSGCRSLIRGMLTELSVMGQIERDAMRMETKWIKTMNDDILEDEENTLAVGAVWRVQ